MKAITFKNLILGIFSVLLGLGASIEAQAQTSPRNKKESTNKKKVLKKEAKASKKLSSRDVIFISGIVRETENGTTIKNSKSKIQFGGVHAGVVYASINETGHYSIALAKEQLQFPSKLIVNIQGYDPVLIEAIDPDQSYINKDIVLNKELTDEKPELEQAEKIEEVEPKELELVMGDSPFNKFVLKF